MPSFPGLSLRKSTPPLAPHAPSPDGFNAGGPNSLGVPDSRPRVAAAIAQATSSLTRPSGLRGAWQIASGAYQRARVSQTVELRTHLFETAKNEGWNPVERSEVASALIRAHQEAARTSGMPVADRVRHLQACIDLHDANPDLQIDAALMASVAMDARDAYFQLATGTSLVTRRGLLTASKQPREVVALDLLRAEAMHARLTQFDPKMLDTRRDGPGLLGRFANSVQFRGEGQGPSTRWGRFNAAECAALWKGKLPWPIPHDLKEAVSAAYLQELAGRMGALMSAMQQGTASTTALFRATKDLMELSLHKPYSDSLRAALKEGLRKHDRPKAELLIDGITLRKVQTGLTNALVQEWLDAVKASQPGDLNELAGNRWALLQDTIADGQNGEIAIGLFKLRLERPDLREWIDQFRPALTPHLTPAVRQRAAVIYQAHLEANANPLLGDFSKIDELNKMVTGMVNPGTNHEARARVDLRGFFSNPRLELSREDELQQLLEASALHERIATFPRTTDFEKPGLWLSCAELVAQIVEHDDQDGVSTMLQRLIVKVDNARIGRDDTHQQAVDLALAMNFPSPQQNRHDFGQALIAASNALAAIALKPHQDEKAAHARFVVGWHTLLKTADDLEFTDKRLVMLKLAQQLHLLFTADLLPGRQEWVRQAANQLPFEFKGGFVYQRPTGFLPRKTIEPSSEMRELTGRVHEWASGLERGFGDNALLDGAALKVEIEQRGRSAQHLSTYMAQWETAFPNDGGRNLCRVDGALAVRNDDSIGYKTLAEDARGQAARAPETPESRKMFLRRAWVLLDMASRAPQRSQFDDLYLLTNGIHSESWTSLEGTDKPEWRQTVKAAFRDDPHQGYFAHENWKYALDPEGFARLKDEAFGS